MEHKVEAKSSVGKFFVPALVIAFCSTWIIESITSIFLLDLTATFFGAPNPVSIATTGQLVTLSSIASVIFGFLLGALSVRYDHKKLLLFGVLGVIVGTLGCFYAPNFLFLYSYSNIFLIHWLVVEY